MFVDCRLKKKREYAIRNPFICRELEKMHLISQFEHKHTERKKMTALIYRIHKINSKKSREKHTKESRITESPTLTLTNKHII